MSTHSTPPCILVFGGDRLHEADVVRCERLQGAARGLDGAGEATRLLLGLDAEGPGGVPQDADAALRRLRALQAARPETLFLFASRDRFSAHVARLLCAASGLPLHGSVAALHAGHAVCTDAFGTQRRVALAPGQVLLVDERYFPRVPVDPARIDRLPCEAGAARVFDDLPVAAGAVPLPEAELVLSAGDGIDDWDSFEAVARLLGATVGASKVVCDKGLQPRERQVGSSGTAVAPRVYIALGISGSTQHLQGIADASRILAVNTDPHAAIVRRAELALVTDANALLRALRATLEGARA